MRIGIVTTHVPPIMGGIEVHCLNLARALVRAGHDVVLFGSLEPWQSAELTNELRGNRLLIRRIPAVFTASLKRPTRLVNLFRAVRDEHGRAPFELLHAHQLYPVGVAAAVLSRSMQIPLVITEHGSILDDRRQPLRHHAVRWAGRVARSVVTASEELAAVVAGTGVDAEKVRSMPNAIWPAQFEAGLSREAARGRLGIGPDRFVAATVRRLVPKTGVQYAIRAVPGCARAIPGYYLLVVGSGPMRGELENLVDELGVTEQVRFVGGVSNDEVPLYIRAADLGLLPSLAEATSIAALEFMASGIPVVASSVGGLPEIIEDGRTGFLFDIGFRHSRYTDPGLPDSSVESLVEAVQRAAVADREAIAASAAEAVRDRFSWPAYVERLEEEVYAPPGIASALP